MNYILQPIIQIEDSNGKPLVGGKVYVYDKDTEYLSTIYSDFEGHYATNPVILDSLGHCSILGLPDKVYTVIVKDANDEELFSIENATIISGSGDITVINKETIVEAGEGIGVSKVDRLDNTTCYTVSINNELKDRLNTIETDIANIEENYGPRLDDVEAKCDKNSSDITDIQLSLSNYDTRITTNSNSIQTLDIDIETIRALIPNAASVTNQLADKEYVNSVIGRSAGRYLASNNIGDGFATTAALLSGPYYFDGVISTLQVDDYSIVIRDENKNNNTSVYVWRDNQWKFERNVDATSARIISSNVIPNNTDLNTLVGNSQTIRLYNGNANGNTYTNKPTEVNNEFLLEVINCNNATYVLQIIYAAANGVYMRKRNFTWGTWNKVMDASGNITLSTTGNAATATTSVTSTKQSTDTKDVRMNISATNVITLEYWANGKWNTAEIGSSISGVVDQAAYASDAGHATIADNYSDNGTIKTALDNRSLVGHTHDDRYYTESEIDSKMDGKVNTNDEYASGCNLRNTTLNNVYYKVCTITKTDAGESTVFAVSTRDASDTNVTGILNIKDTTYNSDVLAPEFYVLYKKDSTNKPLFSIVSSGKTWILFTSLPAYRQLSIKKLSGGNYVTWNNQSCTEEDYSAGTLFDNFIDLAKANGTYPNMTVGTANWANVAKLIANRTDNTWDKDTSSIALSGNTSVKLSEIYDNRVYIVNVDETDVNMVISNDDTSSLWIHYDATITWSTAYGGTITVPLKKHTSYIVTRSGGTIRIIGNVANKLRYESIADGVEYKLLGMKNDNVNNKNPDIVAMDTMVKMYHDNNNGHLIMVGDATGNGGMTDKGIIRLADGKAHYSLIQPVNGTANHTIYTPDKTGTMVLDANGTAEIDNTTSDAQFAVNSSSGKITLSSKAGTSNQRGIWIGPHGTDTVGKWALVADTNNNVTLNGTATNATNATNANNADKVDGYHIVVGSIGSDPETIYFM